jgi:arylsulfatase A-like enzyme
LEQDRNHGHREKTRRDFLKRVGQGGAFCLAASFGGCALPEDQETGSGPDAGEAGSNAAETGPARGRKRPNIVVVVSDDHRWNLMGCNGDPYIKTPNMDRLAREGVNFVNAFATSGVCSPSRGSILTGKYSHECAAPRIVWNNNSFHLQETPFPVRLQAAGYHTAHIGKWHLGKGHEPKPGYDLWSGFEWLGAYFDTEVFINGEKKKFQGYADDIISNLAADYIEERAKSDQPFALFVGLKAPHLNFSYAPRHEHAFDGVTIPKPDSYDEDLDESGKKRMKGNVILIEEFIGGLKMFDNSWDKYVKSHYRSVLGLDDALGRILDTLDRTGAADDTVVLYTSDQGYTLGEHGLTEKHYAYEEPMRVPMLLRYPGVTAAGARREEMVLNIDVAPTVLDLCGLPVPGEMTGESTKPLLGAGERPLQDWRDDFLFDLASEGARIPAQLAVRTAHHKLITYPDFPDRELYDLDRDPNETRSVIDDPAYGAVLADMEKRLERLIAETGWLPRPNYPILACRALGPIPPEELDEARRQVLASSFELSGSGVACCRKTYAWKKIIADKSQGLAVTTTIGRPPGHTTFVAISVERISPRDPYSELRYGPYRPFKGYVNGRLYKDVSIPNHPASAFNPPLPDRQNLIVLEMPSDSPDFQHLRLYCRQGSVKLPGRGEEHGFRL